MKIIFGIILFYLIITLFLEIMFRDVTYKNKILKFYIALWPMIYIIGLYLLIFGDDEYDPYPEGKDGKI